MRINTFLILIIMSLSPLHSQIDKRLNKTDKKLEESSKVDPVNKKSNSKLFISIGKNYTNYDYKNSIGEDNENVLNSDGFNFEIGKKGILHLNLIGIKTMISSSISINEYNAFGSTNQSLLKWDTTYIGTNFFATIENFKVLGLFSFEVSGGIGLSHILYGKQQIDSEFYKLNSDNEFDGIFIKPFLEFGKNFYQKNQTSIGLFLNFSKDYSIDNNSDQNLNFDNFQVKFRLSI